MEFEHARKLNDVLRSSWSGLGGLRCPGVAPLPTSLGSDRRSTLRCCPCRQLSSGSLSLTTAQLHDGLRTVTLLVTNAAGNTTSVQSPRIVVDDDGPPAPASLIATAVGNGSDEGDRSSSEPPNPLQPVSGAFAQLCQTSVRHSRRREPVRRCAAHRAGSGYVRDSALACRPSRPRQHHHAATTAVIVPPAPTPTSSPPEPKKPTLKVRTLTWHHSVVTLDVTWLPKGAKLTR